MNQNSVENLIRDKLQAALNDTKKQIASTLLTNPPVPPQALTDPIAPMSEAFSRNGRPASHKPSENAGEQRQNKQMALMKTRLKVQKLQQKAATSPDARTKNADLQLARTQMSVAQQKLAKLR